MAEKLTEQRPQSRQRIEKSRSISLKSCVTLALIACPAWFLFHNYITFSDTSTRRHTTALPKCPQVKPLQPSIGTQAMGAMDDFLKSDGFRNRSIARLSKAVQIPTQTFDDLGKVGVDPRWDVFYPFAKYLEETFPLVHQTLQLEKINTHALLYTWPGTDATLKPTLLMAHQDVVPVPDSTIKQWSHPPFSGHYDGKFVWGRGSSDCKNQLIAILEAVEALIEANFQPRRTLVLSFGFDEEVSGQDGANKLSPYLLKRYGHHGVAAIVDEGASVLELFGATFAVPGTGEKGYVDVGIVVRMPGGHSSIPPKHNGIGVASELVTLIEANPYQPFLSDDNPYLGLLNCAAEYAPDFPPKLKHLLHRRSSHHSTCKKRKDPLALEASKFGGDAIKYLMTTSVAVDLIQGGAKSNALPERTQLVVNHRVNIGSSTSDVLTHITGLAAQIAHKFNLTLNAFNHSETPSSITLFTYDTKLEPAPVTPTHISANRSTPYAILAGTTRAIYDTNLLVAPGIMTGNTDTRYYWDLSEHIFRYGPGWDKEQKALGNIHTVDEKQGVQAHIDAVRWFWAYVRNMDEAVL